MHTVVQILISLVILSILLISIYLYASNFGITAPDVRGIYDSNRGICGDESVGGTNGKLECIKEQIRYCRNSGGGRNKQCYIDRNIKECNNKDKNCIDADGKIVDCPCWPDDIPVGDWGNFNSAWGKCGELMQGGSVNKTTLKACYDAQARYCNEGDSRNQNCYTDRGVPICGPGDDNNLHCYPNIVPDSKWGNYPVDLLLYPSATCGTNKQGGLGKKQKCCDEQAKFCKNNKKCMKDRGCDLNVYINNLSPDKRKIFYDEVLTHCKSSIGGIRNQACYTDRGINVCGPNDSDSMNCYPNIIPGDEWGTYPINTILHPNDTCGSAKQGGATKKRDCCDAQVKYCQSVGAGEQCLVDRGCSTKYVTANYSDKELENYYSGTIQHCKNNGGGQNKNCYTDRGMSVCTTKDQRGCWPNMVPIGHFGTFDSKWGKCGSKEQGWDKYKSECCAKQIAYCATVSPENREQCLIDRNCSTASQTAQMTASQLAKFYEHTINTCKNNGGGQNKKCYTDRGMPVCTNKDQIGCYPNMIPVGHFGTFSTNIGGKCGSMEQGWDKYKPECCAKQRDHCKHAVAWDRAKCMTDRGCVWQ